MILRASSQPNWKFTRLSSIDHDVLVVMKMPSLVSPMISASVPSPGSRLTFVIRMSGRFCQPSARMAPVDRPPMTGAVSRLDRKFWKVPRSISIVLWAGTPSSSNPNEPSPPGSVASAVIVTLSLP